MRRKRFISLLLAAIMTFFCTANTIVYADENEAMEQTSTSVPYMLRTASANDLDNCDTNTVDVWLELDPVKAESVASYQIALKLTDSEGTIVPTRGLELDFDKNIKDMAKIHKENFDADTQIMQIYVAADKNLVQTVTDENGIAVNKLPIGTFTVKNISVVEEDFKIVISGNTGNLKTVNTSMEAVDVAETYGEDFIIPSDGTVYGGAPDCALQIQVAEGKGTVQAFVVDEDGKETLADKRVPKNATVNMQVIPDVGYRLTNLVLTDINNPQHALTVNGNFKFTMDRPIKITAEFEPVEVNYLVKVSNDGSISGTTEKQANFKERAIATVVATVPEGKNFACWKNENGDIVSYNQNYTFVVTSDVTLTPNFENLEQLVPTVTLSKDGTVTLLNDKYRLSYSGTCTVPKGYTLVQRGIVLTNQAINDSNINDFMIGKKINNVNVAICAVSGTAPQFVSHVNNVKSGQSRTARAFLTYKDASGEEYTVYSTNVVELTT